MYCWILSSETASATALTNSSAQNSSKANSKKSSVIISEFSGCSSLLSGAHLVNPFDVERISQAISQVMDCTKEEKEDRM